MHSVTILALAQKTPTSVLDTLPYLVGIVIVILTLTTLWGVCELTARLIKWVMPDAIPPPVPAKAAASGPGPAAPRSPEGIAPEIVAVIAAAVATATGPSHRIISIRSQSATWTKAGRQSVLSSHRIR
jgi:hypothetical protein